MSTLYCSLKKKKLSKGLSPEEINQRVAENGLDRVGDKIRAVAINKNLENTWVRELWTNYDSTYPIRIHNYS